MPLLSDSLSVWEIGLRWADQDPTLPQFWLSLQARDHFRNLMDAILHGHLDCETLSLLKRDPTKDESPEFFIRTYIDDVYAVVAGRRYPRRLLRWAQVDRWSFMTWCERHAIPLPAFWFPPGWGLTYLHPEDESSTAGNEKKADDSPKGRLRANQRTKITCQEIAKSLWRDYPDRTIAAMVQDELIQVRAGANRYTDEVVRGWLSAVAPDSVKAKKGRPKKK